MLPTASPSTTSSSHTPAPTGQSTLSYGTTQATAMLSTMQLAPSYLGLQEFLSDLKKGYLTRLFIQNGYTTTADLIHLANLDNGDKEQEIAELLEDVRGDIHEALATAKSLGRS